MPVVNDNTGNEIVDVVKFQDQPKLTDSISVVVPVYRSEHSLQELHRRILSTLEPITNKLEVIYVDDAGDDGSWGVICELARLDSRVRALQHSRNYGQHSALLTGIRAVSYDIIVTLDDDLQNPPEEIPKLLNELSKGYDVVYGVPENEQHGFLRNSASQITKIVLQGAMGAETARKVSAFRVFRTLLRDSFSNYQNSFICIDVLLTWGTTKFSSVKVNHESRQIGKSNYTLGKLINHGFNMVTGFSVLPLQIASFVGFFFSLIGFSMLIFILGRYFAYGSSVSGFPFLASIIVIFSGAQMFALGIIGEYLARVHLTSMGKPSGIVRQSINMAHFSNPNSQPDRQSLGMVKD